MSVEVRTPFWHSPRVERAAAGVAIVASLFYTLAALWELFGPLPGGHLGNACGCAIAGENMLTWRIFAAVPSYVDHKPAQDAYYAHHPYGVFIAQALSHKLFGHGFATVRIPAVLCSALAPFFLYRLSRAVWGVIPAATATVCFTLTPINLAFSTLSALEVETICFGLLFSWATAQVFHTWQRRYIVLSTLGALGACQSDWVGIVLVGVVGTFAFLRAYVLPRRAFGRLDERAHAQWFALATAAGVGTVLLYVVLFAKAGRLQDLLFSYENRTSGSSATLAQIFGERRRLWVVWMLPPIALSFIAAGAPLSLLRLLRGRIAECVPIAWLVAASTQYFVFRQGADVHIFWPQYYGVVAPLGLGALVFSALQLISRVGSLSREPSGASHGHSSRIAFGIVLAPVVVSLALLGRVGVVQLYQSRLTGGRFDDGGRYIAVDQDRAQFADWAARKMPPFSSVAFHRSFPKVWHVEYAVHRPVTDIVGVPHAVTEGAPDRFFLLDSRHTAHGDLQAIAARFSPELVGPLWFVDRAKPFAPLVSHPYVETQPRGASWFFVTGSDLIRRIDPGEDAFHTWEWREHLGVPGDPPRAPPASAEEARIAHNAARSRGDEALAASLRRQALLLAARPPAVEFDNDIRLLGCDIDEGSATVVSLLWETGPAFSPVDSEFLIRSRVIAPPRLWASGLDYFEKEVAPPTALKPALWKPGRLYLQRFVAMRRVGTERFEGVWAARGSPIRAKDGRERVELFTLKP